MLRGHILVKAGLNHFSCTSHFTPSVLLLHFPLSISSTLRKPNATNPVTVPRNKRHLDYTILVICFFLVWFFYTTLAILHIKTNVSSLSVDYSLTLIFAFTSTNGLPFQYSLPFFGLSVVISIGSIAFVDLESKNGDAFWAWTKLAIGTVKL